MTQHRARRVTHSIGSPLDYLPAAGNGLLLPIYDLGTRLLGINRLYDELVSQAELEAGHQVLEIGCGTGNLVLRANADQPGAVIVGSDPDPRALALAEKKATKRTGIRFDRGYAQRLPYPDNEFDRVLSSMMLHHLGPEAKVAMAAEVKRVLRPGGRLHLVDIGGDMTPADGFAARMYLRNSRLADNLGSCISRLLETAGLHCAAIESIRHRVVGRLTFYRADNTA
ncbi:class I SAM-dependent methyltransferase [Nocardia brasiliensis]|uniref:Methyltransferase n=1 Tax=Nocardia brasiliensis (strain ATCC 700358 / HUJEG-1) TaxID=1133849 RepID=K0F116_NOCB7|nr:class I SAM-dependent methyltransferase [Nocardia brasiliensis]AFU02775.1 methyltransferase [Nocardia brasiliensis ATCC 700358]